MEQLEIMDVVHGLDNRFIELIDEIEHKIAWNRGPYSMQYLQCWRDKYYAAHVACKNYFTSSSCKQCLIVKLRALNLDHYTHVLDYDSEDSGIETNDLE